MEVDFRLMLQFETDTSLIVRYNIRPGLVNEPVAESTYVSIAMDLTFV